MSKEGGEGSQKGGLAPAKLIIVRNFGYRRTTIKRLEKRSIPREMDFKRRRKGNKLEGPAPRPGKQLRGK